MKNIYKKLSIWAIIVAAVLMIPLIGKAPWTASDYIFAGTVLFGSATAYEVLTQNMSNKKNRLLVGAAVVAVVVLIWGWAVAGP